MEDASCGSCAVTVTTVLFNSEECLGEYVQSLAPAAETGLVRVVAVDNASPDNSARLLEELLPGVEVLASRENLGFAGGCNLAWPLVASRYWLLLNPDVQADEQGLGRLVRWMEERPDIGAATPLLRDPRGRALTVARPHDSLWRPIVEAARLHKLVPRGLRSRWLLSGRRSTPERIRGWVPGAAMIVRREAVLDVGLLNADLFMYGEDREWCLRMQRHGWAIGVCNAVEFVHRGGNSARRTWTEAERLQREVTGHLRAARMTHGRAWVTALALIIGSTLLLEAMDPRRETTIRDAGRARAHAYFRAATALG